MKESFVILAVFLIIANGLVLCQVVKYCYLTVMGFKRVNVAEDDKNMSDEKLDRLTKKAEHAAIRSASWLSIWLCSLYEIIDCILRIWE